MKTLKKVLSLVLVVAMIASMLIVGAAAATEEETQYDEAVAVVTGVGIIEGDENGYNFKGGVTREQAAKIIAYLLLGKETAESLKTTTAPFADVAANRWSAGYVAYLKGQGIISGVSDTEFDPTAPVTGIAFAKMLLTAVGYGQAGEFEGKDWDINTITFANDNGVFTGTLAADLTKGATREEAMLYAFNVLTGVPTVKYNKTFESYYTGTSALDPVDTDVFDPADQTTAYGYTLAWTKYMLKQVTTGVRDDFGRPAATWAAAGTFVTEALANRTPSVVLTGSVYSKDIYNAFGKTVVKNLNDKLWANINLFVDGDQKTQVFNSVSGNYDTAWGSILAGEWTNQVSNTGATVEMYLTQNLTNGDYSLDIIVSYEHLGEVKKVSTVGGVTTLTIDDVAGGNVTVTSEELDVSGFAKKDMVIFTQGYNTAAGAVTVKSLAATAPVVGTFNNYNNTMRQYVINGAFQSASAVADASAFGTNYGASFEIYYDSMGNILYAEDYDMAGATGVYNYLYVQGSQATLKGTDLINNADTKVAFDVVYPNGGQAIVNGAVKTDSNGDYITFNGSKLYVAATDPEDPTDVVVAAGWYAYTTNDAGEITLKVINPEYANTSDSITTATAKATITGISNYTANSATVLNIVNEDGTVISYTGINNFPADTFDFDADTILYTYAKDSKVLKTVTAYVGTEDVVSNLNLAYCAGDWQSDENGTTYMFYVDGVMQFITLDVSTYVNAYNAKNPDGSAKYNWQSDPAGWSAEQKTVDDNYKKYVPSTGNIYDLTVADGEYDAVKVGAYTSAVLDNDGKTTTGTVNAGVDLATNFFAADKVSYGWMSFTTFATYYYEWATIDTIDDNYFTTVGVDVAGDGDYSDTVAGKPVAAHTYYFDENTIVYDITGAGATEISEGDVFVAYVDQAASAAYAGEAYCSIIWIVG